MWPFTKQPKDKPNKKYMNCFFDNRVFNKTHVASLDMKITYQSGREEAGALFFFISDEGKRVCGWTGEKSENGLDHGTLARWVVPWVESAVLPDNVIIMQDERRKLLAKIISDEMGN